MSAHAEVEQLEHDVDLIRTNLGELVGELNQRRHDALDLRLQFQRHAGRVILVGAALIAMVAGGIMLAIARSRHRRSLRGRATRLGQALRRALAHPEHLAERRPSVARKIAAAGGGAMASAFGKRLASRLVST
ncbi:MAG TPA: hypothetical protein VN903_22735 [Polyangia bacterium]|jgi:hypothetical protein|nr:hypothetical protein [Polyangia bacterium]